MKTYLEKISSLYHSICDLSIRIKRRLKLHFVSPPPYIGRHKDFSFFVLCTGPSLIKYESKIKAFIRKENPIIIGCNRTVRLIKPTYQLFCNRRRFMEVIKEIPSDITLIIDSKIDLKPFRQYLHKDTVIEPLYNKTRKSKQLIIDYKRGIIDGTGHVALFVLCVTYLMGAKKIYIAGMDGTPKDYLKDKAPRHFEKYTYRGIDDQSEEFKKKVQYWDHITTPYLEQFWQLCKEKDIEVEFLTPSCYFPTSRWT